MSDVIAEIMTIAAGKLFSASFFFYTMIIFMYKSNFFIDKNVPFFYNDNSIE